MTTNTAKKPARHLIMFLYFLCLVLLVGLGGWQLIRGLEKSRLETRISALGSEIIRLSEKTDEWASLNYARVEISGSRLPDRTFLQEGRIHNGQSGYEVFKPFVIENNGPVILVNWGWIERGKFNENLLKRSNAISADKIQGRLYFPDKGFTIGPAYIDADAWPVTIQYLDFSALSDALALKLETAVVVRETDTDENFDQIWTPYVVDATRHYGYTAQWWGLAVVFVIFGLIWKNNPEGTTEI